MIEVTNLIKRFDTEHGSALAIDGVTVDVEDHLFFTLLGPSGCGKSTLLRCIAGLETPNSGEIRIGGTVVFSSDRGINVHPSKRRIGMVFQSYAVWPHMTVFENVAFPLRVQRNQNVHETTMNILNLVGLGALADRYAPKLSGGQQQRVAFARAIVAEPKLLLLDEPLSNLDASLREQMRVELRNLQERLRVTTLFVTHDQSEALSLSDKIALMKDGNFVEIGSPQELYSHPKKLFTAEFIGGANILEGTVKEREGDLTAVATVLGTVWSKDPAPPGRFYLFIRPEKIHLIKGEADHSSNRNVFSCSVKSNRFVGDTQELQLTPLGVDKFILRCKTTESCEGGPGSKFQFEVDPTEVHILKLS